MEEEKSISSNTSSKNNLTNTHNKIALFEKKQISKIWHNDEWYFSVVDVIEALTDSANPRDYLKKIRKRDEELGSYLGTNCPQVEMLTHKFLITQNGE